MQQFQESGALKPIDFVEPSTATNYAPSWITLGTIDGKLYSFVFKGANKSTVWYNVQPFENAGVEPPKTWTSSSTTPKTLRPRACRRTRSAAPTAGRSPTCSRTSTCARPAPTKYDQLADAQDQVDRPVGEGRRSTTMAQIFGDTANIVGGTSGALQTEFPTSVENVFIAPPKAAMVIEGDFVPGVAATVEGRSRRPATTCSRSRRSTARRPRSSAAATRS